MDEKICTEVSNAEKTVMQNVGRSLTLIGKLRQIPSKEIRDSVISVGMECLDRDMFDPERCYGPIGECGIKYARVQTGWALCEKQKGVYDFAWLDHIVDSLTEQGVKTWFNLSFGNPIYMKDVPDNEKRVGCVPLYFGEETLQAWLDFVHALVIHFTGRVKRYEIWNEPEASGFWYPKQPDPLEYARLIRLTAPVIRKAQPDAEIGSCSNTMVNYSYTPFFIRSGIAELLDFHCIHIYTLLPEKDYSENIAFLRRLWDANGGKHVKLCQGESGYPSWFPEKHWMGPWKLESQTNQAKILLRRYLLDLESGLDMSSFFQMADMTRHVYRISGEERPAPARHGLLDGDTYQKKRSYYAMSHICAVFDNETKPEPLHIQVNTFEERPKNIPVSRLAESSIRTMTFIRQGYPVYAYYLPEDVQMDDAGFQNMELFILPGELPGIRIEKPVLVDLLTGNVYRPEKGDRWKEGIGKISGLPITDYPLLLTDERALAGRIDFAEKLQPAAVY